MNIVKIETDFVKGLFSKQNAKYCITRYEGRVGYCDGYYIALVPESDAYVKTDCKVFNAENVITNIRDYYIAYYSNTITTQYGNLMRYDRGDGKGHAYVDVKYTRYFDRDASYYVKDHVSPVHVYEHDDLVGIICPVNIKEEEN